LFVLLKAFTLSSVGGVVASMVIPVRPEQMLNASPSIRLTFAGTVIVDNLMHPINTAYGSLVIPLPIVTLCNAKQFCNI
jgi:hypothetical protein